MSFFSEKYSDLMDQFGTSKKMVLSTAEKNIVSSRMMSVIQINGKLYFQTDKTFRKYRQIAQNPSVALCIDNIQIERFENKILVEKIFVEHSHIV